MSVTFTASNGIELRFNSGGWIERRNGSDLGTGAWDEITGLNTKQPALVWDALREFVEHERDKELGRWRWPENLSYVVYRDDVRMYIEQPAVIVINEANGATAMCGKNGLYSASGLGAGDEWCVPAAAAYFAAHPEPRPWHDAKPGEVWEMTFTNGQNMIGLVTSDGECFIGTGQELTVIISTVFTAGRRVWPEVTP